MTLRDLLVSLFVIASLPVCFRRPLVGLLMFSLLAYMRLQDLAWGFARFERWSFYVVAVTLAGWIVSRSKRLPVMDIRTIILVAMVVFNGVGLFGFGKGDMPIGESAGRYLEYVKIVFIALFTTAVIRTRMQLRMMVWVIALSFGFYGVKNGMAGVLALGQVRILRGPGGMIADNNDFALALVMAIPLLLHIGTSERRAIFSKTAYAIVPLTMLTVGLTHSRGGFLSMVLMLLVLVWRSRNRIAGILIALFLALAGAALAPATLVDRLDSIRDYEHDDSAQARFASWAVAGRMIRDNPLFGVGFDRFQSNYIAYEPGAENQPGRKTFVAHNSYLQVWAECGTPALLMYLSLILISFVDLWLIRRQARQRYHASWILSYVTMFEASLAGFMLGSFFLNRAHFDLIYHFIAIILVFGRIARAEMATLGTVTEKKQARSGALVAVSSPGFRRVGRPKVRGFRSTPLLGGN